MSEKKIKKDFEKLSNRLLTFFILICVFLIALTYISFAEFYIQTNELNKEYGAKILLNDIQYKPAIQPIVQVKIFGGNNNYYFKVLETGQTYYASSKKREFVKSFLLPREYFSKPLTIEYGIVNVSQSEIKLKVVDGPLPEFSIS